MSVKIEYSLHSRALLGQGNLPKRWNLENLSNDKGVVHKDNKGIVLVFTLFRLLKEYYVGHICPYEYLISPIISGSMYSNPLIQFHNLPVEALKLCDLVGCFWRQSFQSDYNIHNVLTVGFKVIRDRLEILLERVDVFRRLQFDQGIVELIVVIPTSVLTDRGNYFSSSRQLHLLNHRLNSFWKWRPISSNII